jgi:predicted Rossmann fold nucleotide-binding protein DprA/Smf involved in DNA uptake
MKPYTTDEKTYLWLDSFALETQEKHALLAAAGEAKRLIKELPLFRDFLIKRGKESVYNSMCASLSDGGAYFQTLVQKLERNGITPVFAFSESYPKSLSALQENAPIVLYGKGDVSLLKTRCFTAVGSRRTPQNALRLASEISGELSEAFTLVTGVAEGGDGSIAAGALQADG